MTFRRIVLVLVAVGIVVVAGSVLSRRFAATSTLFARPQAVPSAVDPPPPPQYAAAVERARGFVREAIVEQNLPGISVAVGAGGALVWAEGFGWRELVTKAPVITRTRYHIGTAAPVVLPAVGKLTLPDTGTDPATAWSPEHIGEPEEDFPGFTFLRENIFRPIGLADPAKPLPGDRATFYVPISGNDPKRGRRLMFMRDLACCADELAFYSTPSDLVRFVLAGDPGSFDGELAGGLVMSVVTDGGLIVAVTSNIAHANTSALAQRIADAFR